MSRIETWTKGFNVGVPQNACDGAHGVDMGLIQPPRYFSLGGDHLLIAFKKSLYRVENARPNGPWIALVGRFGLKLKMVKEGLHITAVNSLVATEFTVKPDFAALDPNLQVFLQDRINSNSGDVLHA